MSSALKKSVPYRIFRKEIVLRIKSIHLIIQIFIKFHRRKINGLGNDNKKHDSHLHIAILSL